MLISATSSLGNKVICSKVFLHKVRILCIDFIDKQKILGKVPYIRIVRKPVL